MWDYGVSGGDVGVMGIEWWWWGFGDNGGVSVGGVVSDKH